jgi:hypothetical protein
MGRFGVELIVTWMWRGRGSTTYLTCVHTSEDCWRGLRRPAPRLDMGFGMVTSVVQGSDLPRGSQAAAASAGVEESHYRL